MNATDAPVVIEGIAQDAKLGPIVQTADGRVYSIDGLDEWPDDLRGKRVRVTGRPEKRDDLPVFVQKPGEPIRSGIPVASEQEAERARWRTVIVEATWEIQPE